MEVPHYVTIEHSVKLKTFYILMVNYINLVDFIIPIAYLPTFQRKLSARHYEHDPAFLRSCLSIGEVTVSPLPRKIPIFGLNHCKIAHAFSAADTW
jgi:hypothetical protein